MTRADDKDARATAHTSLSATPANGVRSEGELAAAHAAASSPAFLELKARHERRIARGQPALVIVDRPLPDGAVAWVRLAQHGPVPRYIVFSRDLFSDVVIMRALGFARRWENAHLDDESPMAAELYPDLRFEVKSEAGTAESGRSSSVTSARLISSPSR